MGGRKGWRGREGERERERERKRKRERERERERERVNFMQFIGIIIIKLTPKINPLSSINKASFSSH